MKTHKLKTWPVFFNRIVKRQKKFELRKNDRDFKAGDFLLLQEYKLDEGYTGREITVHVGYVLENFEGIEKGYCVMSIDFIT